MRTLPARWPFDVARLPFFYGWVIAVLSTLGFLMSVPGQTMGMAVFAEPFIEAFGLTRTQLSTTYFFGTVASSFFLTRAGRWYDRFGARTMIVGASVLLGVWVLFISAVDLMVAPLGDWALPATFVLMFAGFFGVRFAGQGVLTSASRNVLLVWFHRRRGLVSGVRGVVVSLGFSLAPLVLAGLTAAFGWRQALWLLAGVVGVGFALAALVLTRDTPESCGLRPDGADPDSDVATDADEGASLRQARASAVFWLYALALSVHALFGTAVTFHVVAIFGEAGLSSETAFGYFVPAAIASMAVNLSASTVVDRMRLRPLLLAMLAAFITGAVGLLLLDRPWGYWMLAGGFGAGGGLWGVLSNLAFVRFFGRRHLGEISGAQVSISVFASAIGPVLFSVGYDLFGTYRAPVMLCLVLNVGLLLGALVVAQRGDRPPAR